MKNLILFSCILLIFSCKKNDTKTLNAIKTSIILDTICGIWNLRKVDDAVFELKTIYKYEISNPTLKIEMDKNRISGTSGCNSYSANAKITKNSIKVLDKGIMATEMGCQDGNIWENDFFARLMDIKSVKVDRDTLHIINSDKKSMFFVRRHLHALERNNWELTKVNDTLFDIKKAYGNINEPQPTITFDFEKNTVGGWDGCNNFGINIKFNGKNYSSGIVSSDARGCYIGWSEKFYGVLGSNKSFVIVGNNLTLTNKKGETLTFKKIE